MADTREVKVLAIGASAGGVTAIRYLLSRLSEAFRAPIVVVQHIPPTARLDVGLIYGTGLNRQVVEAVDKMTIEPGLVYMACPGYHLLVEKEGTLALSVDEPIHYSRPSIDALFDSVARAYGPDAIGMLLTGANSDGAEGLRHMKLVGAATLVQDPAEAESNTMPKAALALLEPDLVGTLEQLATVLNEFALSGQWPSSGESAQPGTERVDA